MARSAARYCRRFRRSGSVFENFVSAAGTGDKENRGASGLGWNCYASMEQHRVRYVYRDDPEDLGLAIRRST
eukprot:809448-Rhodomonas_salina.1